ncbi:hypothetical protein NP233_g1956 [Leucocoprinus birnbaumii]|uniref:Uncharacterized protein n=1 Tax=Leucocoprinus birnbaumii TaxID=56174 RepID=A0AAD5VZ81_9AGAR|nr:hypothetical protein NP233_g1956 [Leucocoprinus birnbaumii]
MVTKHTLDNAEASSVPVKILCKNVAGHKVAQVVPEAVENTDIPELLVHLILQIAQFIQPTLVNNESIHDASTTWFLPSLLRHLTCHQPPPHSPTPVPLCDLSPSPEPSTPPTMFFDTKPNKYGVFQRTTFDTTNNKFFAPFLNATVYRLVDWYYNGSTTKSLADSGALVQDVLLADSFNKEDLVNFSAMHEEKRMDKVKAPEPQNPEMLTEEKGWKTTSVMLNVPVEGSVVDKEEDALVYSVDGVQYRKLTNVIELAFQDESAQTFHYAPFTLHCQRDTHPPERIITELYNADTFIEEHTKVQQENHQVQVDGVYIETAIAAIMLWSNSTHLTQFGSTSLWPIYCYFRNQSKYKCAKPSSFAAHHLAYIPSLPKAFQDWYCELFKDISTASVALTHMQHELMHTIWRLLLDEDFQRAYIHGMIVKCADSITQLLFPRFFTYSADYPEKILLATIRFLGSCPCPWCKIQKDQIDALRTTIDEQRCQHKRVDDHPHQWIIDRAHEWIYQKGRSIKSATVENILKPLSMVATQNAFSEALSEYGFDYHQIGYGAIQELNKRYCAIPLFGRNTIWRFSKNASAMNKLAGCDFEDLLQCSILVFNGLLPGIHNKRIMDLLFCLSVKKKNKRKGKAVDKGKHKARHKGKDESRITSGTLNLLTYKLHALGDYFKSILRFGTSDGYSTQIGELEHRHIKELPDMSIESICYEPSANKMHELANPNGNPTVSPFMNPNHFHQPLPTVISMFPNCVLFPSISSPGKLSIQMMWQSRTSFPNSRTISFQGSAAPRSTQMKSRAILSSALIGSISTNTFISTTLHTIYLEDGGHSYVYAHVLGIFHAEIKQRDLHSRGAIQQTLAFLWNKNLGDSIALRNIDKKKDYNYHYVNIFVDRDMFMRYCGGGVRHIVFSPEVGEVVADAEEDEVITIDSDEGTLKDDRSDTDEDYRYKQSQGADSDDEESANKDEGLVEDREDGYDDNKA